MNQPIPNNEYQKNQPLCINCGFNCIDEMERDSTEGGLLCLWPDVCNKCGRDPLKLRDVINWSDLSERRTARIFDANGTEYSNIRICDITTGEMEQDVFDVDGCNHRICNVKGKPPLTVIFVK